LGDEKCLIGVYVSGGGCAFATPVTNL